jgi:hypothetical protein
VTRDAESRESKARRKERACCGLSKAARRADEDFVGDGGQAVVAQDALAVALEIRLAVDVRQAGAQERGVEALLRVAARVLREGVEHLADGANAGVAGHGVADCRLLCYSVRLSLAARERGAARAVRALRVAQRRSYVRPVVHQAKRGALHGRGTRASLGI